MHTIWYTSADKRWYVLFRDGNVVVRLFRTDSVRAAGACASWLNGDNAESEIWKGRPDYLETPYGILEPAYGLPELA